MNPFPKKTTDLDREREEQEQLLEILKTQPELLKQYQEQMAKMQSKGTNNRMRS
jgi:hypothetical protein